MKTSNTLVFASLIVTAGYVVACSSDGTGTVPSGVYGGGTAGQFGGAIGTTIGAGGSVAAGGSDSVGTTSPGGATGVAGSPVGGSAVGQAGSTAITTLPSGGSSAITTVSQGGGNGAATTSPRTTDAGGNAGTGGRASAGGNTVAGGTMVSGGTSAAAGATSVGGTTARTGGGATAAGGADGSTGSGTSNWWPSAFDANANPSPSNGKHSAGRACLGCHKTGGQAKAWLFGGTIYDQAGTAGAGHVQVGIKDGTKFFSAYSASNGNIWLPLGSNSVNWATAEIRVRTAAGEITMTETATSGDCNSCHNSTNRITKP